MKKRKPIQFIPVVTLEAPFVNCPRYDRIYLLALCKGCGFYLSESHEDGRQVVCGYKEKKK